MSRNFYGVLRVIEKNQGSENWVRYLWHGRICHGSEFLQAKRLLEPTSYYGDNSGITIAVRNHPHRRFHGSSGKNNEQESKLRIGMIGLGAGCLAAHGKTSDLIRFFEINPAVVQVAENYFYYLENSKAHTEIVMGDGRISLERALVKNGGSQFDILALDAFSGDAPPVHLLTEEAFKLYWQHLSPEGVIVVNVSNRHLNLRPVVRGAGEALGVQAVLIANYEFSGSELFSSEWILIPKNETFLKIDEIRQAIDPWPADIPPTVRWTDDYSNLFRLLYN